MERNFSDTSRYDRLPSGTAIALPSSMTTVPESASTDNKYYDISLSAVGQTTYTLQAAPINSMASDGCGTFTLTQTGSRGLAGNTKSIQDCWRR
jgi:type IV pilus assembly protein PilE